MKKKAADVDRVFHALGDMSRRAMMERLSRDPCLFRCLRSRSK